MSGTDLCTSYAMPGTDLCAPYAMSGTELGASRRRRNRSSRELQARDLWRCLVLTYLRRPMSGTDTAYAVHARLLCVEAQQYQQGAQVRYRPTRVLCDVRYWHSVWAVYLRVCYTISCTAMAYGAISLRACYAMSGTDMAYAATSHHPPEQSQDGVSSAISLRVPYAVSGTALSQANATQCPALTYACATHSPGCELRRGNSDSEGAQPTHAPQ
eukprot:1518321-Rhodomonas_salina.3